MTQPNEARKLCSLTEWKLVESSFSPAVERLAPSDLKSRLERARTLYRKTEELVSLQHSESRKRKTRQKHSMFADVIDRFRVALNLEVTARTSDKKASEKTSMLNIHALHKRDDKEISSLKHGSLSALIDHGQQQMSKSGARGVQGHVGSANRRQQGRRDSKNR